MLFSIILIMSQNKPTYSAHYRRQKKYRHLKKLAKIDDIVDENNIIFESGELAAGEIVASFEISKPILDVKHYEDSEQIFDC